MLALAVIGFGEDKSGHIIGDVCFQELEGILLRVNGVAVLDVPEGDAVVDVEFGVVQVCSDRADMHGIGIDGFELYLLIAPAPQRDEVFHESVCLHEQEDDGYELDIVCVEVRKLIPAMPIPMESGMNDRSTQATEMMATGISQTWVGNMSLCL